MKLLIYIICIIYINPIASSEVFWADTLISYSSERDYPQFAAKQALGKPSVTSDFGFSAVAWSPEDESSGLEWIQLGFKNHKFAKKIFINENYNPGAIIRITAFDSKSKQTIIYSNDNLNYISSKGRIFELVLENAIEVASLKIELQTAYIPGFNQIDAVGIAESDISYKTEINISKAAEFLSNPENLGNKINSPYTEQSPIISPDGKTLFFVRDGHPENYGQQRKQNIWYSEIQSDGTFLPSEKMPKPINNSNHNFLIGIGPGGNEIWLGNRYLPDGKAEAGISVSYKSDQGWTFPEDVPVEPYVKNSRYLNYAMGSDGKTLILSMQGEDSYGSNDLYVSFWDDEANIWKHPINLGSKINTADDEHSPFFAADGKTLYFSSAGYPGFGDSDIFYSKRLSDDWTDWSEPINLGGKINSKSWEGYYSIDAKGEYAYFVSLENSLGREDIFRVRIEKETAPEPVMLISGKVYNQKTGLPMSAKIIAEELPSGKVIARTVSNPSNGDFKVILPKGKKYGFLAEADGFAPINENIDLTELTDFTLLDRNLNMAPIEKGQTIRINNIFFDYNSSILQEASIPELSRLVKLLAKNPNLKIEIAGHTDNIGTKSSNLILSKERAGAVLKFIKDNGINAKQISAKGYGADKPIADNKTEVGRQKNRRVEFIILEN